jgi:hypothetical protein
MAVVPLLLRHHLPDPYDISICIRRMLLDGKQEYGESRRLMDGVGGWLGHERSYPIANRTSGAS